MQMQIENHMALPRFERRADPVDQDEQHERALTERADELTDAIRAGRWEGCVATATFGGLPMLERTSAAWDSAMATADYEAVEMLITYALRSTDPTLRSMADALVSKVAGQHAERVTELLGG
jgi:hypothetical protein